MAESFNLKLAPLEVISEIVKFVDFRTYPNLLEATATSPGLQNALDQTTYGSKWNRLHRKEPGNMRQIVLQYFLDHATIPVSISMWEVIDELEKPRCECGHWAWKIHIFSFPPRRVCYWNETNADVCECYPRLVRRRIPELSQRYRLDESVLFELPFVRPMPPPNDYILLIDLKTIEWLAIRKHGKAFAKQVTKELIEDTSFFIIRPNKPGWELTYNRPVSMGIIPKPSVNEPPESLTPIACMYCRFPEAGLPTYEYVPYDLDHLRDHIVEFHPKHLKAFNDGWTALPESQKAIWRQNGTLRNFERYNIHLWNGWAESVRSALQEGITRREREIRDWRVHWKFAIGGKQLYPLPGIPHVVVPDRVGRVDWCDMAILLQGFWVMRENQAVIEFGTRWNDKEQRKAMVREILQFWQVYDVYGEIPKLDFEITSRDRYWGD